MSKHHFLGTRLAVAFGLTLCLGAVSLQAQQPGGGFGNQAALNAEAAKVPTPRLPNGKPDLTGSWQAAGGGQRNAPGGMFRRCSPFQVKSCMEWTNQSIDFAWQAPMRLDLHVLLHASGADAVRMNPPVAGTFGPEQSSRPAS